MPLRFDEHDEIGRRVATERRAGEVRVRRQEAFGHGAQIGEVAAAAARDQDFFARRIGMVDEEGGQAPLTRARRAHQAGGPRTEDDHVVGHGPRPSAIFVPCANPLRLCAV